MKIHNLRKRTHHGFYGGRFGSVEKLFKYQIIKGMGGSDIPLPNWDGIAVCGGGYFLLGLVSMIIKR